MDSNNISLLLNINWLYVVGFVSELCFGRKMAPRREVQDEQGGFANLQPFYMYQTNISRDILTRYNNRLGLTSQ